MTATALLDDLRTRGIDLQAHGERLRFHPRDSMTPEDLDALRRNKAEILDLLAPSGIVCPWCRSDDMQDDRRGLRCATCKALAWRLTPSGGIARADFDEAETETKPRDSRAGANFVSVSQPDATLRLLAGIEYPPRAPTVPDPRSIADPVTICPTCNTARVMTELRKMTGGRCWTCWRNIDHKPEA